MKRKMSVNFISAIKSYNFSCRRSFQSPLDGGKPKFITKTGCRILSGMTCFAMYNRGRNKGFSLIEMIAVLILVGIIASTAGLGMVQAVQGMIFAKMNAATVQKGQIAMTKLVKEFNNISAVDQANTNGTSITFTSYKDGVSDSHTVARSGNTLTFDGDPLTDQGSGFTLNYYNNFNDAAPFLYDPATWGSARRIIEITLQLSGAGNAISEFKERVTPRNLQ